MSTFDPSDSSASGVTDVWVVRGGDGPIPAGTIVILGQTPDGYEEDTPYVSGTIDRASDGITIALFDTARYNEVGSFDIGNLKEGAWVDSYGREIAGSCESLTNF